MKHNLIIFVLPFFIRGTEGASGFSKASYHSLRRQHKKVSIETTQREEKTIVTVSTNPQTRLSSLEGIEGHPNIQPADSLYIVQASLELLTLPEFPNPFFHLKDLHLEGCGITELPDRCFMGIPTLVYINLSDNEIAKLTNATFEGLPQLERLNLSRNKILLKDMAQDTFAVCIVLKRLILDYNPLTERVRDRHLASDKVIEVLSKGRAVHVTAEILYEE